jgi:hypothetical protein
MSRSPFSSHGSPAAARRCGHGPYSDLCRKPPAPGYNPLGLCAEHLAAYPVRPRADSHVLHFDPHSVYTPVPEATPQRQHRERVATLTRVIALPAHAPCGTEGCGSLDANGIAVCTERRAFERCGCERHKETPTRGNKNCALCNGYGAILTGTAPGCGAVFGLCNQCGLRARINGGPCSACNPGAMW